MRIDLDKVLVDSSVNSHSNGEVARAPKAGLMRSKMLFEDASTRVNSLNT
jgi:hypothetical protein